MKPVLLSCLVLWVVALPSGLAVSAQETVSRTGVLTDSNCRLSHAAMAQGGMSDEECARLCVEHGAGVMLVTGIVITNPDFPGLDDLLGQSVEVTGRHDGEAMVISKIDHHEPRHGGNSALTIGVLSDRRCGLSHDDAGNPTDAAAQACARHCVESGTEAVLVTALPIANPEFPGVADLLGQTVEVSGTQAESTMTVSAVTAAQ